MHGISEEKMFIDLTDDDIDYMFDVNLKSVFIVTQEVIENMIHNKSGCIINISSVYGTNGGSCEVHYSAAKAGVIGFTKALAKEVGPSNIRVCCVAPGPIDTDMNCNLSNEEIEDLKKEILLKRMGEPEDIANCVYMLVSNEYITGEIIKVDGGWID